MAPVSHAASYYADTATAAPDRPALAGDVDCDVCIIGGGFTGLSTALHLAERSYSVVLLESRRIGWGASGRNGGQLGGGQNMAPSELIETFGRDHAKALWALAAEACATVQERIARHAIACDLKPGNLSAAAKPEHLEGMKRELDLRHEVFGDSTARLLSSDEVAAMVSSERYHGGVFDPAGGHLHPLNYALGLAAAAEAAGAKLHEASPVTSLTTDGRPRVATKTGVVRAHHVAICCNGYLDRLAPEIAGVIMPIDNYVLATEPLGEARARALIPDDICVSDTKFVVDYYRLSADHRLLFGGGETYSGREHADIKSFVRRYMLRVFPQLADVAIGFGWGGRLAITLNRLPHFGRLGRHVYFAQGFSGHGVALTALAGKLIAEAIAGDAERFDVFAGIPHRRFPGGTWLRKPGLMVGMLYYALRDRL